MHRSTRSLAALVFVAGLSGMSSLGCSGSSTGSPASGGASSTGGKGSGGVGTGGAQGTGGGPGSGGTPGTGGGSSTGGSSAGSPDAGAGTGGGSGPGSGGANSGGAPVDAGNAGNSGSGGASSSGGSSAGGRGGDTSSGGAAGVGSGGGGGAGGSTRSAGCGKTFTRPDPAVQQTMQVQGTTRYYLVYLPTNYVADTALPLILGFHGRGMNNVWASTDNGGLGFKGATKNAAILVYPHGTGDPPGTSCVGCGSESLTTSWAPSGNDLAFVDALVADIESKYCVETKRVFSAGFSMGAMMSNSMGCVRGNIFRGVAAVEGDGPKITCTSTGTAALIVHGTADDIVPYTSAQASAEYWRKLNGCTATTAAATGMPDCVAYQGCRTGLPVGLCTAQGGGHHVPSNAPANMWTFFKSLF